MKKSICTATWRSALAVAVTLLSPITYAATTAACNANVVTTPWTKAGASTTVPAGGSLQAAIDKAQPGDEIVLTAGTTYTGNITLPNKPGTTGQYITIRSSALWGMPVGKRATPAQAKYMVKLVAATDNAVITTAPGAHHYKLEGLEIAPLPRSYGYALVELGTASEGTIAALPHDIIFDRVYIHGDPSTGAKRGIELNGGATTVANSYISDIKGLSQDTQALCGWNGPGPFTIENNYLEAAGENILFGGADPVIPNLVPSDIVIRNNTLMKLLSWKPGEPSYAGTHWWVKNLLELKNARRVNIDGNDLENIWADQQNGTAVLFTVRNQDGSAPWSTVESVRFTNNVVKHAGSALNILGHDDNNPSQAAHDFVIQNNLFVDVATARWGGKGRLLGTESGTSAAGPSKVTIDHNTAMQSAAIIFAASVNGAAVAAPGMTFTSNAVMHNQDGIAGDNIGVGDVALNAYFPGAVVSGNALIGGNPGLYSAHGGNQFPGSVAEARFTDPSTDNYRLAAGSPLHNAAADRTDIGVNMDKLDAAAACRN